MLMVLISLLCALQKFIRQQGVPVDTACRVYRRYLKLEPEHAEEYLEYLKAQVRNSMHLFNTYLALLILVSC
jgi:hypothetical protein